MREAFRAIGAAVRMAFRADRPRALAVVVLPPIAGALGALVGVWLKMITDGVVQGDARYAVTGAVLCGVTSLVILVSQLFGFTLSMRLREATDLQVDRELIDLASRAPGIEHFEHPEYLDRLELLRIGRAGLSQVMGPLSHVMRIATELIATVGVLLIVHPLLALFPVFGIPSLIVTGRTQRRLEDMQERTAEPRRQALHVFDLATTAAPAKELRVFGLEEQLVDRHAELWTDIGRMQREEYVRVGVFRTIGWAIFGLGFVLAVGLVAREAVAGRATVGDVVLAVWVGLHINFAVGGIGSLIAWFLNCLRTVGRFLWLADYAKDAEAAGLAKIGTVAVPDRLTMGILIDGVRFAYPGTDRPVLDEVNLGIPAGATVAIVGDNGAGKTTLVKLLCRMYEPSEGQILLDGVDLSTFSVTEWRSRVSAGFQDFARFEVEALAGVGVGDLPRVDDRLAVASALSRAGADGLVEELPEGLDTLLGASGGGVDVSGGQWQKLALGRAMMRERPLLLLLDEPTAAIDAETEYALFGGYAQASRAVAAETGGITVLVSHRFSTVRMADLIVVVDGGRIAESGSHAELMARGGLYAELYELQAGGYR